MGGTKNPVLKISSLTKIKWEKSICKKFAA
jgi:hypothetical protein